MINGEAIRWKILWEQGDEETLTRALLFNNYKWFL